MFGKALLIESGGTKSLWCYQVGGNAVRLQFPGIHPTVQTLAEVQTLLKEVKMQLPFASEEVNKIYFYGAGCSGKESNAKVEKALAAYFPQAAMVIRHDLHAAALALFGQKTGIACILGTGSSAAYYDGKSLTSKVPSLGYVLGDEGSGADIGKKFIRDWAYQKVPNALHSKLNAEMPELGEIIERVYQQANPNRYLAQFAQILKPYSTEVYVKNLLQESFGHFLAEHVLPYVSNQPLRLGFVGGVAYHYADALVLAAQKKGLSLEKSAILREPTEALIDYHLK